MEGVVDENPLAEIDQDLLDDTTYDQAVEEEEEEEGAEGQPDVVSSFAPTDLQRDCVRDLWPFAMPSDYYKMIFADVAQEPITNFLLISTSAHPAPVLAARASQAKVHVVLDRVNDHCSAHGQDILKTLTYERLRAIETASADPNLRKRLRAEELCFACVEAPTEQPIRFHDVAADEGKYDRRAGFDSGPDSDALQKGMIMLVGKELEANGLAAQERDTNDGGRERFIVTQRKLAETAIAMEAPCLPFSSAAAIGEFLNHGGNSVLAEGGLVEVTGIKTQDDSTCSIFAALVGCARFIRDCRQVGAGLTKAGPASRRANVRFECAPGAGANDGFLFVRVVTRNGVGIAAGSELVADFGPEYTTAKAGEGSLQKKFKGALDALFQSQKKMDSQPTTPPAATPAVTPPAATPAV